MDHQREVIILMATYNGGAWLTKQLDSIIAQTYRNWKLVIRDDLSTDNTLAIIQQYVDSDTRITLLEYGTEHGSACSNFSELAAWAVDYTEGFVMFADQDDIWLPHKVMISVQTLSGMENKLGSRMPLLAYSTFRFINDKDEDLPQRLQIPPKLELRVLLNENHAWGCTMILNRAALNVIVPIPAAAVNHDYWTALTVAGLGETQLINQDLILYRQHANNVSGNVDNMSFASRFNRYIGDLNYMLKPLKDNLLTVELFYKRFAHRLAPAKRTMVAAFIKAYHRNFLSLAGTLFRHNIFKIGKGKNIVYLYTLFLLRRKVIEAKKAAA